VIKEREARVIKHKQLIRTAGSFLTAMITNERERSDLWMPGLDEMFGKLPNYDV
jgi:hypothetical protein